MQALAWLYFCSIPLIDETMLSRIGKLSQAKNFAHAELLHKQFCIGKMVYFVF